MFGVFHLKILEYQFYIADYFKDQILKHIQINVYSISCSTPYAELYSTQKTRYYHILEQIKQTTKTRDLSIALKYSFYFCNPACQTHFIIKCTFKNYHVFLLQLFLLQSMIGK